MSFQEEEPAWEDLDWDAIFREARPYLWKVCRSYGLSDDVIEDVVQETSIRTLERYDPAKDPGQLRLKGYMARVASNLCVDAIRGKRRYVPLLDREEWSAEFGTNDDDDLGLRLCLAKLPEDQHLVILLRHVLQYSWDEVEGEFPEKTLDQLRYLERLAKNALRGCLS